MRNARRRNVRGEAASSCSAGRVASAVSASSASADAVGSSRYSAPQAAVRAAVEHKGPCYIRLGRLAVESINNNDDYKFELGKGITLREGTDITVVATGLMVQEAVKAADALKEEGISVEVINIHTIKPLDEELVIASAKKTGRVITVEEHNIIGGLGEAVSTALSEHCPTPVTRIGVNDVYGHSGPAVDLLKEFGLSAEHIAEVIREKLAK